MRYWRGPKFSQIRTQKQRESVFWRVFINKNYFAVSCKEMTFQGVYAKRWLDYMGVYNCKKKYDVIYVQPLIRMMNLIIWIRIWSFGIAIPLSSKLFIAGIVFNLYFTYVNSNLKCWCLIWNKQCNAILRVCVWVFIQGLVSGNYSNRKRSGYIFDIQKDM